MYDQLFYIPNYTKYARKIAEKQQFSVVLMCQSLKLQIVFPTSVVFVFAAKLGSGLQSE